jgi:uncharacterized protein
VKVVFDTNILIAAFLTEGLCSSLLIRARKHDFDLILSDDILREFKGILTKKFKISSSDISEITDIITEAASEILHKVSSTPRICRDPNDDMIIACAVDADVDYIVTGDEDLLTLKKFKNIIILNPRNFETIFA